MAVAGGTHAQTQQCQSSMAVAGGTLKASRFSLTFRLSILMHIS